LLHLNHSNTGVDATLRLVYDGLGNGTSFSLSTKAIQIAGADSSAVTDLLINPAVKTSGDFLLMKVGAGTTQFEFTSGSTPILTVGTTTGGILIGSGDGSGVNIGPASGGLLFGQYAAIGWSNYDANTAADTGLKRASAGVVKVTDGGAGLGQLQLSIPAYANNAAAVAAIGANRLYYTDAAGEYIVKISH
jgi:hypothetical protein